MQIEIISDPSRLAALRGAWNQLVESSPMQTWEWLATWWSCYGNASRELFVVVGREDGELVGVAPWYTEAQRNRRVVRWLGDGHVCSDHATLLVQPTQREPFTHALADWLLDDTQERWHELHLEAIDTDDTASHLLVDRLVAAGCSQVEMEQSGSCHVDLPSTFDEYLMTISKNHRKRCRRWDKQYLQSDRARVRVTNTPDDCLANWHELVQLHNARRTSLGQLGAFEDQSFSDFHHQVIPKLAVRDRLQLRVLEVDGQAVAAEYLLRDDKTWYAYQSGLSEAGEAHSAGSLSILALVQDAIASGCSRLDLLRGDEAYKFSWGAVHRPASTHTVRRPSSAARLMTLRDTAWNAARRFRQVMLG